MPATSKQGYLLVLILNKVNIGPPLLDENPIVIYDAKMSIR